MQFIAGFSETGSITMCLRLETYMLSDKQEIAYNPTIINVA